MNPLLIEFLVKASFLLAAAWCFHFAVRKGNARWRVLIWRMLLPSLCLLMVLVSGAPKVGVPVMPPKEVAPVPAVVVKKQKAPVAVVAPVPVKSASVSTERVESKPALPAQAEASSVVSRKPFDWLKLLPLLYAGPVVLLFGGLVVAWVRSRRLVARALPVSGEVESLYRKVAGDFGVHRTAGAMLSSEVASPILVGWLRPRLLLPAAVGDDGNAARLRMIFAHEIAHLSTRDALWNLLIRSAQILLWFHPLAWGMSAAHGRACEEAADGKAAKYAGDVEGYGATLAELALRAHAWQLRATGLPMARAASIPRRLENLSKNAESRRLGRRKVLGFAMVALVVIGLAAIVTLATRPVDIRGVITDATGQPVRGALVKICYGGPKVGEGFLCPSIYPDCGKTAATDASGGFRIKDVDPKLDFIVLTAAPGFEGTFQFKVDAQKRLQRFTLNRWIGKARDGETAIRGRFVDADGKPIAGAMIKAGSGPNEGVAGISGADGTFGVTWKNSGDISVYATAPGFAPKRIDLKSPLPSELDVVLDRGVSIEGRIVHDGKGVRGAQVYLEDQNFPDSPFEDRPFVMTDFEGKYAFPHVPRSRIVAVYASRFGPPGDAVTRTVTINTGGNSRKFVLADMEAKPAMKIGGRVMMPGGQPFPPNSRLILSTEQTFDHRYVELGGDGSFEVPTFPRETIEAMLRVPGFVVERDARGNPIREFEIRDEKSRIDISLLPESEANAMMIEGSVVNAQGIPVPDVRTAIVLNKERAFVYDDNGFSFSNFRRGISKTDKAGRFRLPRVSGGGKVIASGRDGYGEASLEDAGKTPIVLRPWASISGRYAPGGVSTGKHTISSVVSTGKDGEAKVEFQSSTTSDEQGNFVLNRVAEGTALVWAKAVTERGESEFSTPIDVNWGEAVRAKLDAPGCTVTGRIEIPAEIAARLDFSKNFSDISLAKSVGGSRFGVTFGPDGRFEVRGVQPGEYQLDVGIRWKTSGTDLRDGCWVVKTFTVSQGQQAFDLGGIPAQIGKPPLEAGSQAPEFDLVSADGSQVKNGELTGKVLVIQFNRAEWNADDRAIYVDDYFKTVRRMVSDSDEVAYLAFTSGDLEKFRETVSTSNFWKSCHIGPEENSPLLNAYHLGINMPVEVIIGADGKLAYCGQNFSEAGQAALAELGKMQTIREK